MKSPDPDMPPSNTLDTAGNPAWLAEATIKTYRRGETIIEAGSQLGEWVAISSGAACLMAKVAGSTNVAVAALWLGDVIGWNSPLGKLAARYDVNALVDVVTVHVPRTGLPALAATDSETDATLLHAATEARLQDQISMRLAGNGFQRLASVLATLASALAPRDGEVAADQRLALPVAQTCIGQLAGLSRRQTWIYLSQLTELGWVTTNRTRVVLEGLAPWLKLMPEVERIGMSCIDTAERCVETLTRLGQGAPARAAAGRT